MENSCPFLLDNILAVETGFSVFYFPLSHLFPVPGPLEVPLHVLTLTYCRCRELLYRSTEAGTLYSIDTCVSGGDPDQRACIYSLNEDLK